MRGRITRALICAALGGAAAIVVAGPAQAAEACTDGTVSGHWSSITSSVSDLCSGSPQSYSLDSAANVMRGELTLDTDGSLSYSFDPALGSLQGTDDSL